MQTSMFSGHDHFFQVQLELFEGPIDLLLHLVKTNELAIEKIALAQVCDQYMLCIDRMQNLDLDIAAEYILIAATLLEIKSSVLLDKPVEMIVNEDGDLVDPHEELLRRLREAQIYKEGALMLGSRDLFGVHVFSPASLLDEVEAPPSKLAKHDPLLLGKAFRKMIERIGNNVKMNITMDSVSVVECMMRVMDKLKSAGGRLDFEALFEEKDVTAAGLIGTFISLLELCKRRVVDIEQGQCFEQISIVLAGDRSTADENLELVSEFDQSEEEKLKVNAA